MAVWKLPVLVVTAPVMGGKAAPPEMAATSILPPRLVWFPRPRSARVKMVVKQTCRCQRAVHGEEGQTYALKAKVQN
jgi:hypothetical protein